MNNKYTSKFKQLGFTLIELLVVISIIAVLAVIVFVALDPVTRFRDARNSRRWTDIANILTAVHECIVDNGGITTDCYTATAGETYEIVSNASSGCDDVCTNVTSDTHCLDLDSATDMGTYLKVLPYDPGGVTAGHTEYTFTVDSNNIVSIEACAAEGGISISTSR